MRWLFAIALLPGLATALLQFYWSYQGKRSDLEATAQQVARALSQVVDSELAGIQRNLYLLATSPSLQEAKLKRFHGRAQEILATESLVGAVVLVDESGQQVVNTLYPWGKRLPKTEEAELVQRILQTGKPSTSDLNIGGSGQQYYVVLGVPVSLQSRPHVLMMRIRVERLAQFLAQQNLDQGWVAAIIDTRGAVVARNPNHESFVGSPSRPELIALMANRDHGAMASKTLEGKPSFVAFYRSRYSGWSVAVAMPREIVQSQMYPTIALGVLSILGSLVAGFILAGMLSKRIRKSIDHLAAVTALATQGDVNATASMTGPDEVVELASQFNQLQASRREMRAMQERIKRKLLLLNETNTALLVADKEESLLPEICRQIVETGGYPVAWVGFAEFDEGKTVRPIAIYGADPHEYIDQIRVSWGDNKWGQGPTGKAIRTGRTTIVRDLQHASSMAPRREAAIGRACCSGISLPLVLSDVVIGALTIYCTNPDAFSPEEVSLLEKLISNLSFGMERLRVRQQLSVANKELQGFTYAASHDMKAPLQRISTFSGMLADSLRGRLTEKEQTMFGFVRENAGRIIRLVDDLLEHAQIEQAAMHVVRVKLEESVRQALLEKSADIEAIGADVACRLLPGLSVQANPLALSQVLRNLIDNALKYSARSKPPTIRIAAEIRGRSCLMRVEDNGIGFDMAYHDKIFEIFRRLNTHAEFPGTGVGLAIAKKAMERMGGRIWATSIPGEGATFYIELPLARIDLPDEAMEPGHGDFAML